MNVQRAENWYERQSQMDNTAIGISEEVLGPEKDVFAESMALLDRMLNSISDNGPVHDLATKMKWGVANHAFNLLWSAWQNMRAGRYDAATDHFRSIDESPDFLAALQINPSLAKEMLGGRLSLTKARQTIVREMNSLQTGEGNRWRERQEWRRMFNRFAHIDAPGTTAMLPIADGEQGPEFLIQPGGGVIEIRNSRMLALCLAEVATNFLWWVSYAFQDAQPVSELWEKVGRDANERGHVTLGPCAKEIGVKLAP